MLDKPYIKPNYYSNFCPDQTFSSNFNNNERLPSTQESPSLLQSPISLQKPTKNMIRKSFQEFNSNLNHENEVQFSSISSISKPSLLPNRKKAQESPSHISLNQKLRNLRFHNLHEISSDNPQVQKYPENIEIHTPEFSTRTKNLKDHEIIEEKPNLKQYSISHNIKKRSDLNNSLCLKAFTPINLPKISRNHFRFNSNNNKKEIRLKFILNSSLDLSSINNSPQPKNDLDQSTEFHLRFLKNMENFLKKSNNIHKYYKDQPRIKNELKLPKEFFKGN